MYLCGGYERFEIRIVEIVIFFSFLELGRNIWNKVCCICGYVYELYKK
jgi:hypothetical protein